MVATPGEGEQAKGGERQDVARALYDHGWEVSVYPLSRETSRRCCPPKTAGGIFKQANEY